MIKLKSFIKEANNSNERYLGDGVYARFDGQVWIYTSNGVSRGDEIAIDYEVFTALQRYMRDMKQM